MKSFRSAVIDLMNAGLNKEEICIKVIEMIINGKVRKPATDIKVYVDFIFYKEQKKNDNKVRPDIKTIYQDKMNHLLDLSNEIKKIKDKKVFNVMKEYLRTIENNGYIDIEDNDIKALNRTFVDKTQNTIKQLWEFIKGYEDTIKFFKPLFINSNITDFVNAVSDRNPGDIQVFIDNYKKILEQNKETIDLVKKVKSVIDKVFMVIARYAEKIKQNSPITEYIEEIDNNTDDGEYYAPFHKGILSGPIMTGEFLAKVFYWRDEYDWNNNNKRNIILRTFYQKEYFEIGIENGGGKDNTISYYRDEVTGFLNKVFWGVNVCYHISPSNYRKQALNKYLFDKFLDMLITLFKIHLEMFKEIETILNEHFGNETTIMEI